MTIQARPTTYRGIPMRSRLEAHVAAELEKLPGTWEYEPRAFANERGQYLPDFLFVNDRDGRCYLEAKPTVEAALRVMERMQIIWDSEPEATLVIFVPDDGPTFGYGVGFIARSSDRKWRRL